MELEASNHHHHHLQNVSYGGGGGSNLTSFSFSSFAYQCAEVFSPWCTRYTFNCAFALISWCGCFFFSWLPTLRQRPTAPPRGLTKAALRRFPLAVYLSGRGSRCTICFVDFVDGETIRVLPYCGHRFHVGCSDAWLQLHASCPNFRITLLHPPNHVSNY